MKANSLILPIHKKFYYQAIRQYSVTILTKNENFALFNGIYYAWEKTTVPPNVGSEIQSFIGMLRFISWRVSLKKRNPKNNLDIGFSQMTATQTHHLVFTIKFLINCLFHYMSYLPVMHDK